MTARRGTWRAVRLFVLAAVVAAFAAGCSGGSDEGAAGAAGRDGGGSGAGGARTADEFLAADEAAQRASAALPSIGPAVVKTAQLELRVGKDRMGDAVADAVAVAGRYDGFVLSTTVDDDGRARGTVVLRIPAEHFETALSALEGLGDVEAKTVSGEDVGEEFVDLEARARNLRAQEAVLLRLMSRAKTVAGTIRVQSELSAIQLESERIEGRLRYLRDQTALSTVTLRLEERGAAAPETASVWADAWQRMRDGFAALGTAIVVGGATILPFVPLLLVALLVWRLVRPRVAAGRS